LLLLLPRDDSEIAAVIRPLGLKRFGPGYAMGASHRRTELKSEAPDQTECGAALEWRDRDATGDGD
jgi:hypothetical protein